MSNFMQSEPAEDHDDDNVKNRAENAGTEGLQDREGERRIQNR